MRSRRRHDPISFPGSPLRLENDRRSSRPRLTWSETSSKSARPAKDFESCETVNIAESAQCPLVRCPAQLVNHESRKGISEIEGKAARVAASESGSRTSFNQHEWTRIGVVMAAVSAANRSLLADSSPVNSMRPRIGGCHPRTINPEYD